MARRLVPARSVRFAAQVRGERAEAAEVARLLSALQLEHRRRHLPAQMSGGEQQRLAFGCAVVARPAMVVADEPTAELDSASAEWVLAAVRDLRQDGTAIILASHDDRVVGSSDHLLRLERGRVVESW